MFNFQKLGIVLCGLSVATTGYSAEWLRAGGGNDQLVWGASKGIHYAIHPAAVDGVGDGGPRGLIRVGSPTLPGGRYDLINFIAVEPTTTDGRKGLSELEKGADGQ